AALRLDARGVGTARRSADARYLAVRALGGATRIPGIAVRSAVRAGRRRAVVHAAARGVDAGATPRGTFSAACCGLGGADGGVRRVVGRLLTSGAVSRAGAALLRHGGGVDSRTSALPACGRSWRSRPTADHRVRLAAPAQPVARRDE